MLVAIIDIEGKPVANPQEGYNYPVPDNPLVLPPRRTTTTEKPEEEGYNYPVPQNPLVFPTKKPVATPEPEGYNYPVPENPLTLPTRYNF